MSYLNDVERELAQIEQQHRTRALRSDAPHVFADFSTNDYLGFASDARVVEALRRATRVGSAGARLLGGSHREHWLLEEDLARHLHRERALLFSSGYMAALGAIPVLARFADAIYSDALNHASLIDGIRASKCERIVYPHAQLPPRKTRRAPALIVTESLYGMDGDVVDVRAVLDDLHDGDMLFLDEAHALGVTGARGAGLAYELDDPRVVVFGTLSKALGASGGFIAGPERLIDLLVNSARTFIFDTAPPPAVALAARIALLLVQNADDRRERLHARVNRLRAGLRQLGYATSASPSPIVPVLFGDEERALAVAAHCYDRGVYAPAVRPPTVPSGTSRLRISVRADHTDAQIDALLESLACISDTS